MTPGQGRTFLKRLYPRLRVQIAIWIVSIHHRTLYRVSVVK